MRPQNLSAEFLAYASMWRDFGRDDLFWDAYAQRRYLLR